MAIRAERGPRPQMRGRSPSSFGCHSDYRPRRSTRLTWSSWAISRRIPALDDFGEGCETVGKTSLFRPAWACLIFQHGPAFRVAEGLVPSARCPDMMPTTGHRAIATDCRARVPSMGNSKLIWIDDVDRFDAGGHMVLNGDFAAKII